MIPYLTVQPLNDFIVHHFVALTFACAAYFTLTFAYAMQVYQYARFEPLKVVATAIPSVAPPNSIAMPSTEPTAIR